jgi:methylmalonyl-CoA mutase N-terminal domain/subunit
MKTAVDLIEYCTKKMPLWNATYIGVPYNLRDAGLNAFQEIAIGLATAMAYIEGALRRGMDIDDFGPRISFYCNAGIDFFEEIAKLRAMRRMWAKLMKERFKARNPRSWKFRFGVHTAGSSLVPQQPLNNIVRIAYQQLVAVLSGAQSVNSCTFDEPICLPTELSQRVALRTQQILVYETGVALVADPLGGSYYIECLTNKIEAEAAKVLEEIENRGGMIEAVRTGWVDQKIEEGALNYHREIERGERIIVGMNAFTIPPEEDFIPGGVLRIPSETEQQQIARVERIKKTRDNHLVREALEKLYHKAQAGENLIPPILEAVKVYATIEEIQGTIRQAFGYSWDPFQRRKSPFQYLG